MYAFKVKEMDDCGKHVPQGRNYLMTFTEDDRRLAVLQMMDQLLPMANLPGNEKAKFFVYPCRMENVKKQNPLNFFSETISINWEDADESVKFWKRSLREILKEESFQSPVIKLKVKRLVRNVMTGRYEDSDMGDLLWQEGKGLSEISLNVPYGDVPDYLPKGNPKMLQRILRDTDIQVTAYQVGWTVRDDFSESGKNVTIWVE